MRTAAYARYSSDQQRDASLEDQLRNCRAYCARMGWSAPVVFQDAAISGSRQDRPAYQQLLEQAERFDVILVDDLTRLSRDSIETAQALRRLRFRGVRVIGVSDDLDTSSKGHKINAGLRGLMGELYLDDLAEKTHRGLTGRALAGASAGGLPFGYRVTTTGQRAIDEAQADVVRRIVSEYLAGESAREIAHALNRDGIPSARGGTWAQSAIHGDTRRGIGILANPIYSGRQVWNRSRFVKHPDSGRRVRQERPVSEWITTEHPELAIIDAATWQAVQAKLRGRHKACGGGGRPARYLLSGILRCGECGGAMVAIDRYRYGCATAKDRGTCSSTIRFPRKQAEHALLADVRARLLQPEAVAQLQRQVAIALKKRGSNVDAARKELEAAQVVHGNVMAAIRAGILTPSTRTELLAAEARVEAATAAVTEARQSAPATLVPRARELLEGWAAKLEAFAQDTPAARIVLRQLIGERGVVQKRNGAIVAEFAPCQINVVAGACLSSYLTGPAVFQLSRE